MEGAASHKFKRGDRVEVNALFRDRLFENHRGMLVCLPNGPPLWVPLWGMGDERNIPHEGTLGTVLGYQEWLGVELVRVTVADTQTYLFSEEVLNHL